MAFLEENLIYLIPVLGLIGIIVMIIKSAWVNKQESGDENMNRLATYIAEGSMAFLRAEWKVLSYFVVISALLLAWSGTLVETSSWIISISFISSIKNNFSIHITTSYQSRNIYFFNILFSRSKRSIILSFSLSSFS